MQLSEVAFQLFDVYQLVQQINTYDKVYIYGSGMVGQNTMRYLRDKGQVNRIACFLISDDQAIQNTMIEDKPVKHLLEIAPTITEKDVILLAAKKDLRKILDENCDHYALKNRIHISAYDDRTYEYYANLDEIAYPIELRYWYFRVMGYELNLENPRDINEKINWMKLYDNNTLKTTLTDKYLAREYVKNIIGENYIVPLLGVWDTFEEIDVDALPQQFVLKCNHGCWWNEIVKDRDHWDIEAARQKFHEWLSTNYAFCCGFEMQYRNILPKIICEPFLKNSEQGLFDFKFMCFHGKVEQIMLALEKGRYVKMNVYDRNWNLLQYRRATYQNLDNTLDKPDNFDEMIHICEKLSRPFPFVRVDLYRLNTGEIKFGEMTFTPASGTLKWTNERVNDELGDKIKLN